MNEPNEPRVIVALDYAQGKQARELVARLEPEVCKLKIGKELFTREGPDLVREFTRQGYDVFLDLKYHDIPNTVARACEAAAELGVWMVNVHASGGGRMMKAASEALSALGSQRPLLIAVTVLTSMGQDDLNELGVSSSPEQQVLRLADLARKSGLDGVVCSPREAAMIRSEIGGDFKLVTPGVRPAGVSTDDQVRVLTPADAIRAGSDYLVLGRPVTKAVDPMAALSAIQREIAAVL